MGCATQTVKYLLFFSNFLFFVSGLVILVVGGIALGGKPEYDMYPKAVFEVAVLLVVIGCFVTIISFFGCCGAIRENRCMLYVYIILLVIIFIIEIAGGIAAFVYKGRIEDEIRKQMDESLKNYNNPKQNTSAAWDYLQRDLQCCGINNASDWENAGFVPNTLPWSCCKDDQLASHSGVCVTASYTDGCLNKLSDLVKSEAQEIGGVAIGIAFVQLLSIAFGWCLVSNLKHRDYV